MKGKLILSALGFALAASLPAGPAATLSKIGTLSCDVSAGVGLILVEKRTMSCAFTPIGGGPVSYCRGRIAEYGLAVGAVEKGNLLWNVIAAVNGAQQGALAGTYAGVGASTLEA